VKIVSIAESKARPTKEEVHDRVYRQPVGSEVEFPPCLALQLNVQHRKKRKKREPEGKGNQKGGFFHIISKGEREVPFPKESGSLHRAAS